jgi:hypothetical protein
VRTLVGLASRFAWLILGGLDDGENVREDQPLRIFPIAPFLLLANLPNLLAQGAAYLTGFVQGPSGASLFQAPLLPS